MILPAKLDVPRVLGRWGSARSDAPRLLVFAGVHGNEPAGVLAAQQVHAALAGGNLAIEGEVVFVAGNRRALARGVRYVDQDLNRSWHQASTPDDRVSDGVGADVVPAEALERQEILEVVDPALARAGGPVYALDLHTTSGAGGVFSTTADSIDNRDLAQALPVPLVLGLEELLDGTLHDYLDGRGCITLAFEAGQHDDLRSVERAEAAIWLTLAETGLVSEPAHPEVGAARRLLARDGLRHPPVLEMRYRHPVGPDDGFLMNPGFDNFAPVRRGQPLARDRSGRVVAPTDGRILMPLYQVQGNDGYFIVREFRPIWLHLSRMLRGLHFDRWVHWLPGVRVAADSPDRLVINRRVARWFALQVLHLLGYRRMREQGDELVVLRRPGHRDAHRVAGTQW